MSLEPHDATVSSTTARPPFGRRRLLIAAKLLLIAVAVYLLRRLFEGIESEELDSLLTQAEASWLALAAAFLAARAVVWGWRWNLALHRAGESAPTLLAILAVTAATAVNHVTPGARVLGGFLRARWLSRGRRAEARSTFGGAFGTVLFDQAVHQVATGGATLVALVAGLALFGQPAGALALALSMAATLATAIAVWRRRRGERLLDALVRFLARRAAGAGGRMQKLFRHSREAVEVVQQLGGQADLWSRCLVLGALFVAFNTLAQWAAFVSLGTTPSLFVVFIGVALGSTAGILLGTPGGVGATEAAMIACYVALGVERLDATAAVLLYRGLHYVVVLALGLPSVAFFELRDGRLRRGKPESLAGGRDVPEVTDARHHEV